MTASVRHVPAFAETPALAHALAADSDSEPRATPGDAFSRARAIVHSGVRLDMKALAAELGVGRATLYRWTGERERLLADIIWTDVDAILDHVLANRSVRGVDGVEATAVRFLELLTTGDRLTTLLRTEGATAFRLITDAHGWVRPRIVAKIASAIQQEADEGFYRPPETPELIADAMVTVAERFLYHGGDPTQNPDPVNARRAIALLVRER